jgi:formate--tetrahydrofolate ligase
VIDVIKSDIEIARECKMEKIENVAKNLGIDEDYLELYGKYKAKINLDILKKMNGKEDGKLVLVTAINPTKAGEGKTTTTIGLGQAFAKINKKAVLALREPSMGPVFGLKGGAAGGGYAQVVPMDEINLHFTGDMHAITSVNNLISACLDNHLYFGNELNIDPKKIVWKRCLDLNDRALRNITVADGGKNGATRKDSFNITVASEVMAILCLCEDLDDFGDKIGEAIVAYTYDNRIVKVKDLGIVGALKVLMKDAIKPNLVQTLENTPVLIHGGPFANIAHGCNSLIATKMGLKLADYCITEAGFGADLGAEKFFDIKCRDGNLKPNAVVVVATIRALKMHGGALKEELNKVDLVSLEKGVCNLKKHLENIEKFGVPSVVAINKFSSDSEKEVEWLCNWCKENNYEVELCEGFSQGGEGAVSLANKVIELCENKTSHFTYLYEKEDEIEEKIEKICKEIYGANSVEFSEKAMDDIKMFKDQKLDKDLLVCIAKTPMSLSDDDKLIGRPMDFNIHVKEVIICNGAKFAVIITGNVLTMPGLPKIPAANKINIDKDGKIEGLF